MGGVLRFGHDDTSTCKPRAEHSLQGLCQHVSAAFCVATVGDGEEQQWKHLPGRVPCCHRGLLHRLEDFC